MTGIVVEVIAAFGISIISGLEIADLTDQAAAANLEAKLAVRGVTDEKLQILQLGITNAQLVADNLVLRSNVAAVELAAQWRTITPTQEIFLVESFMLQKPFLNKWHIIDTNAVNVEVQETDVEARWYAKRLVDVLKECGFNAVLQSGISASDPNGPGPFVGLGFLVKNLSVTTNSTVLRGDAGVITGLFQTINLKPDIVEMDTNLPDGGIEIIVGHKPGG